MSEIWKDVPGYEGLYQVSNIGSVRSLRFRNKRADLLRAEPKVLTQFAGNNGRKRVRLCKKGKDWVVLVYRLVLIAFVGTPPEGHEAAHLDGDMNNNNLTNLRWVTRKENHSHKILHGTNQVGMRSGSAKLTDTDVLLMRDLYETGRSMAELSRFFKCSLANVSLIVHGKGWKHLPIRIALKGGRDE